MECSIGDSENSKDSANETHRSSESEMKFDRSESPENARYSPSDESGMSQNDITPQHSYPIPDTHFLWKQHLRDATAEKGRLEETAAVLGEKTEKLKYELADAQEASRSRDEVIALLQGQLKHMEEMYTSCLEDVSGYRLRLVNQEQELQLLKEICNRYEEEKEAMSESLRAHEAEREDHDVGSDNDERILEVTIQLREREKEHTEMKIQLTRLEQEKRKSMDDILSLERKNEELEKKLGWSSNRIQILSEDKVDASEKSTRDLNRVQEETHKWKEQYESCIVNLEHVATSSDEVRDELREIIQKLEELKEKDDSSWQDKIQEEVTSAVLLLRDEYAKVECLITKHNEQLEALVQQLQKDLEQSLVRQSCLESQLGQTRNELVAAQCSNQNRESSSIIDELRRANAELRDQAERVRSQIEIRDEDLKNKLLSLNDFHRSESKLNETSKALEETKQQNNNLRYQVESLVIEKCVSDAKISSLQCVIDDGEALRLELERSKDTFVKAALTHSETQTNEVELTTAEASNVEVQELKSTLDKLHEEFNDRLKPIQKTNVDIQTDMSITNINMLMSELEDLKTRLEIAQQSLSTQETLANDAGVLRSEFDRLTSEFVAQEEELKRTLVILKDTRNAAKAEFSRENSELRQQLDEAKLEIQKYKEDLMESESYFLDIPYPVIDSELCPPPDLDIVAQRAPLQNDVKPRGSKLLGKGIFSSVLTAIDDVNEEELSCIPANTKESQQTESKELESVEEPTISRSKMAKLNNAQHDSVHSLEKTENVSSKVNTSRDKTSVNDAFSNAYYIGNGVTNLNTSQTTHAPAKQININAGSSGYRTSTGFKASDFEEDDQDSHLNTNLDLSMELRKELQLEKEKCKKNHQTIQKLRQENETLKVGTEYRKVSNAEVYETTSPSHNEQIVGEFRRKVNDLEQQVRDDNSKRFALELQVNKMRYDIQEKVQLEKELGILRNRLEKDFVSRYELEQLRKMYDVALSRAKHDAEKTARNELNNKLGQINALVEKRHDEGQLQRNQLRETPENMRPENMRPENMRPENMRPENMRPENMRPENMRPEYREARLKLQLELANAQATMDATEDEEKREREKRERKSRESEEQRELQRRKLIEMAYNVNLAPATQTKEKELGSKSVVCVAPQPVCLSPDVAGAAVDYSALLRGELEKNLRKHSQESLNEQPSTSKITSQTSYDELDLFKKKYF